MTESCDRCRGTGMELVGETNDQYDHTHGHYDVCRDCGGTGEVEVEPEDDE